MRGERNSPRSGPCVVKRKTLRQKARAGGGARARRPAPRVSREATPSAKDGLRLDHARGHVCRASSRSAGARDLTPGGGINERAFSSGTLQRTQAARFVCGENSSPSAKNRTRRQKRYMTPPTRARVRARVTDPRRVSRDRAISTRPDDRSCDPVARAKPRRVVSGADAARVHRLAKKIVRRRALVRVPRGFSKPPEPAVTKGVRRTRKPLLASFQPERANPRSGAKRADREKISFRILHAAPAIA